VLAFEKRLEQPPPTLLPVPAPGRPGPAGAAAVWVLLGRKAGDNRQLLAIAEATRRPFRAVQLRFNAGSGLPPLLLGERRLSWRSEEPLRAPWPALVLAAGKRSVSAALWIRGQSGGMTRLVHVNRPWAPLSWFDLVVTTPQYALPDRPNVLQNLLPFVAPRPPWQAGLPAPLLPRARLLPRPWTVVLVGGDSRPYVLDVDAARGLARRVNDEVHGSGGSAWVVSSPRTPAAALDALQAAVDVPAQLARWGGEANPYPALLALGDRFLVTVDSASMLAEALTTGKPVAIADLPKKPDWRWRAVATWRELAARDPSSLAARGLEAAVDRGLVTSVRDMGRLRDAVAAAGALDGREPAGELARRERRRTLARIDALIEAA
jgi:mitochondrial fission protein ELM1